MDTSNRSDGTGIVVAGASATTGPSTDSQPMAPTGSGGHTGEGDATASPYVRRTGPPPRHVLLLSIDTVRADRLNGNGYVARATSPHLDALLGHGLALRNHHSCSSWTMASFLCVLTGQDQVTHGVWPDNNRQGEGLLPYPHDDLPSLAWRLSERGFATRLVTANALIGANYEMDRGFDQTRRTFAATETADVAIEQLDELTATGERWFLHAHFMAPHTPYDPDEAFLDPSTSCADHDLTTKTGFRTWTGARAAQPAAERAACDAHLAALYDALLAETDHHLARILAALEASDDAVDTAIVFVTDHGEGFGEHDDWEHGYGNYEELTRSTAGVVYPPRIAPAVHDGLTTHVDLLPTLWTVLDEPVPAEWTGHPIGSAVRAHVVQLTYRNAETVQSITTGHDKLILHWEDGLAHYDLDTDPGEQNDLWSEDRSESLALWALLEPHVIELAGRVTDGSAPTYVP